MMRKGWPAGSKMTVRSGVVLILELSCCGAESLQLRLSNLHLIDVVLDVKLQRHLRGRPRWCPVVNSPPKQQQLTVAEPDLRPAVVLMANRPAQGLRVERRHRGRVATIKCETGDLQDRTASAFVHSRHSVRGTVAALERTLSAAMTHVRTCR
jgi:hypothetical protein